MFPVYLLRMSPVRTIHRPVEMVRNLRDLTASNQRADSHQTSVPGSKVRTEPKVTEQNISGVLHDSGSDVTDEALLSPSSDVFIHGALVSRGITSTVADRARVPIIGLRYGLPLYFARYASSMRSFEFAPSTGSNVTSFVMPAAVIRPAFRRIAAWYQRELWPLYART